MKTCNEPNCNNPVWSHLKCRNHQWRRTDSKKPKPMNTVRKPTGELDLFKSIWEDRQQEDGSHLSEISGMILDGWCNTSMFVNMFAHVIDKGKRDDVRLVKDNIVIMTPKEHFLIHYGTIKQRQQYEQEHNCSFQIFFDKQEQLKIEYNK
jgi:hypothetical protein